MVRICAKQYYKLGHEDSQNKTTTRESKRIKVGPWGGQGGDPWDDGSYNGIRSITLVYDHCIDSIRVEYEKNGKPVLAERHGGSGGRLSIQIKLAYPEEYLTAISGFIAPVVQGGFPVIRSLKLKSNMNTFGPYGVEEGTQFALPIEGGMVIGFHGRSDGFLISIGMYLSRIHSMKNAAYIYESVHQKIQKLGNAAYKKLGDHKGCPAKAKTSKAINVD